MKNRRNYYRILHIQPDAPMDIIKASYRTQMQKLKMHPDLGGDEWNACVLNEAYQILSNPQKRAAYDAEFIGDSNGLKQAAETGTHHEHARKSNAANTTSPVQYDPSTCPFCNTPKPAADEMIGQLFCSSCNGPLQTAATLRLANSAKRTFERMPYHSPLTIFTDTECDGIPSRLRNLSPVGLQLQAHIPVKHGQLIRVNGATVAAIGRVIFCNRDPRQARFIIGLEFITVRFHQQTGTFIAEKA